MKNILTASLLFVLFVTPAFADKPDHAGKNKSGHSKSETYRARDGRSFLIPQSDKAKILSYLEGTHRKNCPPGLAKKNNGCLPPGQFKKRYAVGKRLTVDSRSLPQKLLDILSPPPQGAFYRMVDDDVVLMSQTDQQIMDAVSLISNVQ